MMMALNLKGLYMTGLEIRVGQIATLVVIGPILILSVSVG
jgi:hypothetical protein